MGMYKLVSGLSFGFACQHNFVKDLYFASPLFLNREVEHPLVMLDLHIPHLYTVVLLSNDAVLKDEV